tara:strand:+ start:3255 stop:3548 length:294 start_codon:yes stop_codon:yes gene_type:complete
MFTTEQIVAVVTSQESLEQIEVLLQRDDVQQMLSKHKITLADIRQRLPKLAPSELHNLAKQIKDMPETDSSILVALVPSPVILLLELTGYTDISTSF